MWNSELKQGCRQGGKENATAGNQKSLVQRKCLQAGVVHQASVNKQDVIVDTYIGLAETPFNFFPLGIDEIKQAQKHDKQGPGVLENLSFGEKMLLNTILIGGKWLINTKLVSGRWLLNTKLVIENG